MKHRTIVISRVLMVLYFAALAYLCFWHFKSIPKMPKLIWGFEPDKLVHFAMFLPFPILFYFTAGRDCFKIWKAILYVLAIFIIGCALGAGTELMQGICTKYRTPDIADFNADAVAIAVSSAMVFVIILIRRAHKKLKNT